MEGMVKVVAMVRSILVVGLVGEGRAIGLGPRASGVTISPTPKLVTG